MHVSECQGRGLGARTKRSREAHGCAFMKLLAHHQSPDQLPLLNTS